MRDIGLLCFIVLVTTWPRSANAQQSSRSYCRAASGGESHAVVFQRWIDEVWHQGRLDVVPDLVGPEYVRHEAGVTRSVTPERYAKEIAAARQRLPDVRFLIHDCVAVEDRVWTRWTMIGKSAETGQLVRRVGTQIYRLSNNRLVETWMLMPPTDGAWPEAPNTAN